MIYIVIKYLRVFYRTFRCSFMGNESTSSRIDLFEFLPASSHQFQNKEEPIALLGPKNHGPWNVFFPKWIIISGFHKLDTPKMDGLYFLMEIRK